MVGWDSLRSAHAPPLQSNSQAPLGSTQCGTSVAGACADKCRTRLCCCVEGVARAAPLDPGLWHSLVSPLKMPRSPPRVSRPRTPQSPLPRLTDASIAEALRLSKGDQARAVQLLFQWEHDRAPVERAASLARSVSFSVRPPPAYAHLQDDAACGCVCSRPSKECMC